MLTLCLSEKSADSTKGSATISIPEFTVCAAMLKDGCFARIAFGALDDKDARNNCASFKRAIKPSWLKNGCSHFTISADDGTLICTWHNVNVMPLRRVYQNKEYWFFEVEGLYRDIIWN